MQFEDKMTIATPEGVSLEVTLAGAGSRAGAAVLDGFIQFGLIFLLVLIVGGIAGGSVDDASDLGPGGSSSEVALFAIAILNVILFVVLFFYFVVFETLWSGQTPGKRAFKLRAVQVSGARIGFKASMIRNLVRIVDLLPSFYLVGILAVVLSTKNQRLGDMVAGTVVVRDRQATTATWAPLAATRRGFGVPDTGPEVTRAWDLNAITGDDLATVRAFLQRRHEIPIAVRERLAGELDGKLRPKVAGAQDWTGYPEVFLELLAAAKSARS